MPVPVAMPKLGMTMEEGTVLEWRISIGDRVEKGQTILLIESEKTEVELEATASGWFRHVYVEPDEAVPCGTLLGAITDAPDEAFDAESFREEADHPAPVRKAPQPAAVAAPKAAPRRRDGPAPVAPAARALARKLDVDVAKVPGTGPGGRVTREDVETWAERRQALVAVADGVSLEVPAQGEGDAVLLLPGFGVDVSAFARQVPPLSAGHRVLGVNPRGVGLSDAPEAERYEIATAAADAAALLDGPAHLIGASLGSATAIELALSQPEKVRTLVLITPFASASARLLSVIDAWCRLAREVTPQTLAAALLPWLFSDAYLADARARERTLRGLAETAARVPASSLECYAEGLRAWSGTREDDLGAIAAPTLVLGAGDDLLTPDAGSIADAIPGARRLIVPQAGHAVALEAPDPVNEAILSHLAGA
jgi:pyruvate dehydrogenase E2 component (dihydrolipoamide acetyltransferase)